MLGADAQVVKLRFGILPDGNAPEDPQQEFTGKNLLYVARSIDEIARDTAKSPAEVTAILERARLELFGVRLRRPRPHRDDKILTAWNGLMIAAFARMARVLAGSAGSGDADAYRNAAIRAAAFIRERMWNPESRILLRRYRDGHAEIPGYAEDYSYLIFGLIELFQTTSDMAWFDWAADLQRRQDELFWDEQGGGWFSTDGRDATVLLRMKEEYDGAEPSPNSVSVLNLLWLTHLAENAEWNDRVERTLRFFGTRLEQLGRAVPMMGAALSTFTGGVQQLVLVDADSAAGGGLRSAIAAAYLPFAVSLRVTPDQQARMKAAFPFIAAMQPVDGRPTVYVCRNFACRQPVTTETALQEELRMRG